MKEEKVFDMAKFFDKESLINTLYTLHIEAGICDKDYRIWYKCMARVSVITNSIGQGSFGAALSPSLNIGCAPVR